MTRRRGEAEYWVRHVATPVRFADGLAAALETLGLHALLELGPRPVLTGAGARRCSTGHAGPVAGLAAAGPGRMGAQMLAGAGPPRAGRQPGGGKASTPPLPPHAAPTPNLPLPAPAPLARPGAAANLSAACHHQSLLGPCRAPRPVPAAVPIFESHLSLRGVPVHRRSPVRRHGVLRRRSISSWRSPPRARRLGASDASVAFQRLRRSLGAGLVFREPLRLELRVHR